MRPYGIDDLLKTPNEKKTTAWQLASAVQVEAGLQFRQVTYLTWLGLA